MRRIKTHGDQMLSRSLSFASGRAFVIGLLLIIAIPGLAQETKKPRKGYGEQQAPKSNPDLERLNRLVGTWKITDPTGKGELSGQVTYEWMEGGFFLIQRFDLVHYGRKVKGIEIIGHEQAFGAEPGNDIKSRVYDTVGNTLDYVYEVDKTRSQFGAATKVHPPTSRVSSAETATLAPAAGSIRAAADTRQQ